MAPPDPHPGLAADLGVQVVGRIPSLAKPNEVNRGYLQAKEKRMAHLLDTTSWDERQGRGERDIGLTAGQRAAPLGLRLFAYQPPGAAKACPTAAAATSAPALTTPCPVSSSPLP